MKLTDNNIVIEYMYVYKYESTVYYINIKLGSYNLTILIRYCLSII